MKEELSLHNKVTRSPGKAMHTPLVPIQEKSIRTSAETPKLKLDESENLGELERWLQTPKTKAQPLEDLAGFQELFQTSYYAKDSMTSEKTPKLFCRSPQLGPVDSPMSKRCRKTSLEKEVMKDLSLARELTQMSKKTMYISEMKDGSDKSICCEDSVEQIPNPTTNESGGRRQRRTTKVKAQLLEDLTGFQELFETPGDAKHPITADETTKMPYISPNRGLLRISPTLNRHPRASPEILDMKEVLSAPMKLRQSATKGLHMPLVPVHKEKSIRASTEAPMQKQNLRENLNGLKRQLRTPKANAHVLEDLTGFQELFQTPCHVNNPITPDETTKIPCRFMQSGSLNTPTTSKRRSKTSLGKTDRKEMSFLQKRTQTTEKAMHTSKVLEGDDKVFKGVVEQTLIPAATSNKKQSRKCKEDVPPLEDLAGFQELFQTPDHAKDLISIDETTKLPCISVQRESIDTPTKVVRRSTRSLQRSSVKEHLAVISLTQISGKVAHTYEESTDDKDNKMFKKSKKRKLDTAASVTPNKRPRGESKKNVQPLEDLTGFKEMFKTPGHIEEPGSDEQTTQMPGKLQPESVDTPRRRKALPSTPQRKRAIKEKQVLLTPKAAEDDDKGISTFKESAKQTRDLVANVSGSRCTRIPQIETQVLEDLTTFQELFQTPDYAKDPITTDETTRTPCMSLQVGSLYTPTASKRHSKISLGKTDGNKVLSSNRTQKQSLGRAMHTPSVSVQEQKDIKASTETPKQNLNPRENLNGLKRQPRTLKAKAYVLEDLTGFQELFQTPGHDSDPVASLNGLRRQPRTPKAKAQLLEDLSGLQELFQTPISHSKHPPTADETPKSPHRSPQSPSMDTLTASKRCSKISLGKIDMKEELSSLRKLTQSPGKTVHSPLVPVQEWEGIRASTGTPQQKLAMTENLTDLRSCPKPRKTKTQPLEDLAGFQELFQTPQHTKDLVTPVRIPQTPHRSQSTPMDIVKTSKRCPKTSIGEDVKAELSVVRKQTLKETMRTHKKVIDDKDNKVLKEIAKRKLDPAENVTGTKRLRQAPKEKTQTLEDLSGLQELFQIPGHTEESISEEKATIMPHKSPQSEPIRTPTNTKRDRRTRLRKVNVKEDSLAVRKPTRTSRAITQTSDVPEGDDKGLKPLDELEKKTLDLAAGVSGSRRCQRAAKLKAQSSQDVTVSREVSQTGHTEKAVRDGKPSKITCKSPQVPGDTSAISKRRPRTRFGKVDVTEELSAQKKQIGTSGETMDTHKEPTSDNKSVREFKESAKQKLDQEENITGNKRLRGTRKEKTQLLEDLAGSKELIPKSAHTEESLKNEKTTEMPCNSSQPEPVDAPANTKRQLRTRLGNVNVKEGLSVVRKPTRMSRVTTHTSKMPEGDDKDIKESSEQTLNPAITSNRRYLRATKAKSQVKDLPGPKEINQTPNHTEEQINDVRSPKSTSQQIPDSIEPRKTLRRALRVHKEKPIEDLVDTKEPAASQNEPIKENRVHSEKRTAPGERQQSPDPLNIVKKRARIVINRIEPVEEQNNMKSIKKEQDSAIPIKGMSLRTRRQNKIDGNQQRLEIPTSEKAKIKRREKKTMQTSEEIEQESPDDGAGKPTSDGKASGNRVCLRSGRQSKNSQLHTAAEDGKDKSVNLPVKNQKEKEVTDNSETVSLRPRRARIQPKASTLERDSEPRTTRSTKRSAENLEKDKSIMETNKIRTRSHRNIENI
ncbi:proliferation marker protein Ki-67-like [Octodon degus]|uniref:Proliferation marker protein Ki-67-like n=1 Tax=Octodon degus TaxID=10160 RepID=A0A6P6DXM3_OCTDE|nr:proliferation marker protein Ki-67-like [Octodon degus]